MIRIDLIGKNIEISKIREAMKSASKSASQGIGQFALSLIPNEFTVTEADVKKYGRVKVNNQDDEVTIHTTGERVKLIHFKHSPDRETRRSDRVSAEVKYGENRSKYPAFIRKKQIFERIRGSRLPIRVKRGSSVPEMLSNSNIRNRIERELMNRYERKLNEMIK